MRIPAPPLLLSLALAISGCSSDVMLGQACSELGCELREPPAPKSWPDLPEPEGPYAIQLETAPHTVLADGAPLDRCEILGLTDLGPSDLQLFLTETELLMTQASHHVAVYFAAEVDLPNGEVACEVLRSESIDWRPLLAARGEWDYWDARAAPFPITSRHRVLINHHYENPAMAHASKVSVLLNLHCTDEAPAMVSESFSFEAVSAEPVAPGASLDVIGEAHFERPVRITTLFRRTHMIERFAVERLDADGNAMLLWAARRTGAWKDPRDPPVSLPVGDTLRFTCTYENPEFTPLRIGGSEADACALLGISEQPWEP